MFLGMIIIIIIIMVEKTSYMLRTTLKERSNMTEESKEGKQFYIFTKGSEMQSKASHNMRLSEKQNIKAKSE